MKKTLLLSMLVFGSLATFAQTVTFGVKAGANFAKETHSAASGVSPSNQSLTSQSITGFHVGGLVDIGFDSFSIQPGLLFSTKGGKLTVSGTDAGVAYTGAAKETLNYLELPVNLLYKVSAGSGKVFLGAGPYLGYALSGKDNSVSTAGGMTTTDNSNVTFGSNDANVKRMDYGVNFLVGYQMTNGLSINANFGLGLANLEGGSNNGSTKNQVIGVSLGYFFK